MKNPESLLQGEALKQAARRLMVEVQAKMNGTQHGVGTFCDYALLDLIEKLEQLDSSRPWEETVLQLGGNIGARLRPALQRLQGFLNRRRQGRFVDVSERFKTAMEIYGRCEINDFDLTTSQGAFDCLQWRGMPIFKTVYDFSLYTMILWELKPRTIIELGSGTGASAIWLADLTKMFGLNTHVYSMDLKKPELQHEQISFIQGDCWSIDAAFGQNFLSQAAHPWMVIEDAHANVYGVLSYFHTYITQGDYLVIEDSINKQDEISDFLLLDPLCYKVDTYYTDFFGPNATCSQDSILVRV